MVYLSKVECDITVFVLLYLFLFDFLLFESVLLLLFSSDKSSKIILLFSSG